MKRLPSLPREIRFLVLFLLLSHHLKGMDTNMALEEQCWGSVPLRFAALDVIHNNWRRLGSQKSCSKIGCRRWSHDRVSANSWDVRKLDFLSLLALLGVLLQVIITN